MDFLEKLRELVGPEAKSWSRAKLEQLDRDMDAMAILLLDLYRCRKRANRAEQPNLAFDTRDSAE